MTSFTVAPKILQMNSCKEMLKYFEIGSGDLFITSHHAMDGLIPCISGAEIVYLRDFGEGEPTDSMVEAIYQSLSGKSFERVIAMGGGSVLDVGKLFCLKEIFPVNDLFNGNIKPVRNKKLIMVPTTCGTGSEVTDISVLELTALNTKKGLAVQELYADYAVLIPELLEKLPFSIFAASSIDAFIHCVESYLSPKANSFIRMYSIEGIKIILNGYIKIAREDSRARFPLLADFLTASTYAGISFGNAGCAAVHALSYPLGATYHIPHGESNYALLAGVLEKYKELKPSGDLDSLECLFSKILGCEKTRAITKLNACLNNMIPKKALREYGIKESELEVFTKSVIETQQRLLSNNYIRFTYDDILEIYKNLY